ncbi:MAG: triacylglycerol lipase [Oscillospiraceae bacterium]|jgi:triacylglycerol lipase|nr:triacylglycerol lipase [Oscillospiraceae bacterium]
MFYAVLLWAGLILLIISDALADFWITKKYVAFVLLFPASHIFLISSLILAGVREARSGGAFAVSEILHGFTYLFPVLFACVYFLARLLLYTKKSGEQEISLRLRIMMGGRRVLLLSLLNTAVQIPLCILLYSLCERAGVERGVWIADLVTAFLLLNILSYGSAIKIFFTSKRVGVGKRILLLLFMWIPPVNIITVLVCASAAKKEYRHECMLCEVKKERGGQNLCRTKYPILLVHGIGFADNKIWNYWGRIPKMLSENGAEIYYGEQQAFGTIESNAKELRKRVLGILGECECEKVNIIAHSKGGLDTRHMISALNMEDKIASLTTISTPHRGSELVDIIDKLPDKLYAALCGAVNWYSRLIGDKNPDTYHAVKQLSPAYAAQFNEKYKDSGKVYYQSYAAEMNGIASDFKLGIFYAVLKLMSGANDGMVSVESAKWGVFKGSISSKSNIGVSHIQSIDVLQEDYEGFDIFEKYFEMVVELKKMGF